ncbi:MAG: hypothetical protein JXA52_04590, partial [Planctomycetes bacterium]|nr:hypothetical protein [Planctomycetota bacterium]
IRKMRTVKRAALAPANPSAQDRRVAANAGRKEIESRRKLTEKRIAQLHERLNAAESYGMQLQIQAPANNPSSSPSMPVGRLDTAGIDLLV